MALPGLPAHKQHCYAEAGWPTQPKQLVTHFQALDSTAGSVTFEPDFATSPASAAALVSLPGPADQGAQQPPKPDHSAALH
eukprot:scaffold150818_cov15-Tisochrysis_lutea.AAC.1